MIPNSRLLVSGDSAVVRDVYIPVESTQTWLRSVRLEAKSRVLVSPGAFRCSPLRSRVWRFGFRLDC
jgi:hypothetical protein